MPRKPVIAADQRADHTALRDDGPPAAATPRHWLGHATEPHLLYPGIAVLMLALIWGTTLNLVKVEQAAAEQAAASSVRELAVTYESQVVRALREIDQTLKLARYAYGLKGGQAVLQELKARTLLPPELLFAVSIADSNGNVVASTHLSAITNVAGEAYFQSQRQTDALSVGRPRQDPASAARQLHFSRRLDSGDGGFSGVAMVAVDASYFVSGYEISKLGGQGVLGLLGTDGVFRVRRSGETLSVDDLVKYASLVPAVDQADEEIRLVTNPWDGVQRYIQTHRLFEFPFVVVVGLSADEQLAGARRHTRAYLWTAAAASLLVLLIIAALGRMSRQLALSRRHAVEEQMAHAERIRYLAYHDGLTTLPNRSLFSKLLAQSISLAHRHARRLAVLFLDLDRFKHINDTLGHEAGDLLLQEVAARLKSCLRDSDTVARLGGDEFVVLLPDLTAERYAARVAEKILSAAARPFVLLGQEVRVTASIGISVYPEDGLDEQTLKKNADVAMYQAKELGRNNFKFFSPKLNAESLERLNLESGLRHALERNEFRLHYQAKRDMRSGRIAGVEALLRWQHPDLGMVAPMRFIPVAEDTGLILPIGKWVLRTACLQNVAWHRQGLPALSMAVNLSARQFFDATLLADLAAILADTGMDPNLLELEISENLLMRDPEEARPILAGLRDMGVRMAIDDFGIGYSSLSILRQFPINAIKIDRSFSRDLASVAANKDLTEAIIAMGRTLSLTVVAQGVETQAQAEYLREAGCDEIQGFYLSEPLPAEQVAGLVFEPADLAAGKILAAA